MNDVTSDGTPDIKYYTGQGKDVQEYLSNILNFEVADIVVPIINYSELAYKKGLDGHEWNLDIQLLFIDSDHRFNYVKKDIELWAKHVVSGGRIVFHDYPFPGVMNAIKELILNNDNPRYINFKGVGVEPIVHVSIV